MVKFLGRHKLYEDEVLTVYMDQFDNGELHTHNDIRQPTKIKHLRDVMDHIDVELQDRGVKGYYTVADSEQNFRFNQLFGFEPIDKSIPELGLEFMYKDLT